MIVAILTSQVDGENPGYCEESRSNLLIGSDYYGIVGNVANPSNRQLKLLQVL